MVRALVLVLLVCSGAPGITHFAHAIPSPVLKRNLEKDLKKHSGATFDRLVADWKSRFGNQAAPALYDIAGKKRLTDSERYVALMAAARLGAAPEGPLLKQHLNDKVWMVRVAALRVLSMYPQQLPEQERNELIKARLNDKALVVRLEAIESIKVLHPADSLDWLADALVKSENYHHGKALWVPFRILDIFATTADSRSTQKLLPILKKEFFASKDRVLIEATLNTLDKMNGLTKTASFKKPHQQRIAHWLK